MARMTLYLNETEHARLAELAEDAGVSRSAFLRGVIMGVTPAVDAVAGTSTLPPVTRDSLAPPRGGEFSKDAQVGKAKR